MTVTSGVARTRFIGTGSTGPFAFNHKLYDQQHLTIVKTDTSAVDTVLTLTTDYTVAIAADENSATITLTSALAGDGVDDGGSEILTITRDPAIEQPTSWPRNDPFPAATHERAADLAVMMIGRLAEKIGRSILLAESSTLTGLEIPPPVADRAIGWNSTADNLANIGIATFYSQASAPTGQIITNSIWYDSDSIDIDVYQYDGTSWVDTGMNAKGATGATGATGAAGTDGEVAGPAGGVVDNEFVYYNGTTGKIIKASGLLTANDAAVRSATANRLLTTNLIETASAFVTLTDGASISLDWDSGINFNVTLAGNRTLANPTNGQPGTWRTIRVIQDATGSRTLTFGAQYKHPGGAAPILTTTASAVDVLSILCVSASEFYVFNSLGMA